MKYACAILFALLTPLLLSAQADEPFDSTYSGGRAFLDIIPELEIGFPIGDFRNKMDKGAMVGKGISVFYRLKNQPVDVGLRVGDFAYDNVKRNFVDSIDGADLVQKTKNKIWIWYGAMRYAPMVDFPIQPYFEGLVGMNRFLTKTFTKEAGLVLSDDGEDLRFDEANLNSDWVFSYGGAIGFKLILEKTYNTALDVQVGFRSSDVGRFYVKNDLQPVQEEPLDNFDERRGALSVISLKIGISVLGFTE